MFQKSSFFVDSPNGKKMLADVNYIANGKAKPVIVFSHGFKGFKDWGAFNQVSDYFASKGFVFLKFNFSGNGTTAEQPEDFADLEAFSKNTYSLELDELGAVIDQLPVMKEAKEMDLNRIFLIGHSRGGGISILKAAEDIRVKGLVTWAAVSDYASRFPEDTEKWKAAGTYEIYNGRTKQNMPIRYTFFEDFLANKERLDILERIKDVKAKTMFIHGLDDPTVNIKGARMLQKLLPTAHLLEIAAAGHTFNTVHPQKEKLPEAMRIALGASCIFLEEC